jgi:dimethylargininase
VDLAREQHASYCAALRRAGLDLIELPPDEDHPDACFVQDMAVPFGHVAVVGRPGAPSREGELPAVRHALQEHMRLYDIQPPGTLEGGDVLVIGTRIYVGLSARTNRAGYAQLREVLELEGAAVEALSVPESLHLLSDCTYLGRGVLLALSTWVDHPAFAGLDVLQVPPEEAYAANALAIGQHVIAPDGYPQVAEMMSQRGFEVLLVHLSEFAKADGGATCLALPF